MCVSSAAVLEAQTRVRSSSEAGTAPLQVWGATLGRKNRLSARRILTGWAFQIRGFRIAALPILL